MWEIACYGDFLRFCDFMKAFYVSWNALETLFHEILWKKNFALYHCLKFAKKVNNKSIRILTRKPFCWFCCNFWAILRVKCLIIINIINIIITTTTIIIIIIIIICKIFKSTDLKNISERLLLAFRTFEKHFFGLIKIN